MTKVLFNTGLSESNAKKRDFILTACKKIKLTKDLDLLEVGIGNGRCGSFLANKFKSYDGFDPDEEYVELAKRSLSQSSKAKYVVGVAESIPFDKKYDVVLFAYSFHFTKFGKAWSEVINHLKDKGLVIVLEPDEFIKKWADPVLTEGAPEFDQKKLDLKKGQIRSAKQFLEIQPELKIIDSGSFDDTNYWILRK
ncbi:hypothetical protein COV18_03800 [Candidatus Woesearchaeota archaeon CG10_big_fil_rev_8_21_14_0_10_37_12]|nr:MAG: hypothetical protein COV18_03800 [Candidatus Woesearchaeota archaeon CG10_big_fil_rev_8_21_14_0_10_37_12]